VRLETSVKWVISPMKKIDDDFAGRRTPLWRGLFLTAIVISALGLLTREAHAAPQSGGTWKTAGSSSWSNGSNWSNGTAPNITTSGTIDNGGTATFANGVTGLASTVIVGGTGTGALSFSGGTLADTTGDVGDSGSGTVSISSGSWGNSSALTIGNSGTGVLNMTGASAIVSVGGGTGVLTLAMNAGSVGTLNYSTAGTLEVGSVNGGAGTATVNFISRSNVTFAPQLTGNLAVNFSDSHSDVPTYTLTGSSSYAGSTTISDDVTVNVSGGQLSNDQASLTVTGANDGGATLEITNNGYVASNNINVANTNTYDGGEILVTSGTLNATGMLQVGGAGDASIVIGNGGTVLASGTVNVSSSVNNSYIQVQSGGTLNVSGSIQVGTLPYGDLQASYIEVDAGATFTIGSGTGQLVLGGTAADGGSFGTTGELDYYGGTLNFASVTTPGQNSFGNINIYTGSFAPQIIGPADGIMTVTYLSGGTFTYTGSDSYSGNTGIDNGTTLEFAGGTFNLNNPNGPQLYIAEQDNDTGAVIITNNANVRASYFEVGGGVGSSGTLTMDSGTLTTDVDFTIGEQGAGIFNMSGGTVNSNGATIGGFSTGSGTATITGGTWNDSEDFSIGSSGPGVLNVQGGSVIETGVTYIGTSQATAGTLNVTSGTYSTDYFVVGNSGSGTLNVNGGYVSGTDPASNNYIGSNNDVNGLGVGIINVTSGTLSIAGPMYIGLSGSGALNVNGGYLSTAYVDLGYYGDQGSGPAMGTATVSSGTWVSSVNIVVGDYGDGTLNVSGGVVDAQNGLGSIYLGLDGGAGVLNFSGGTLDVSNVYGCYGPATINFTTTTSSTFSPDITTFSSPVSVNQTGAGDTVLTGNSNFAGTTTVSAGTLTVNGSLLDTSTIVGTGTLNGSGTTSDVTVNSGGLLGGTLHSGNVTVNAGGAVTAGDAPGENTMTSLALSGSATYQEQIVVPGGGSYTGSGNHPIAGTDYGQTTLTGAGNGQTALTLDSTHSILQLNVTGSLPAGGVALPGAYNPAGSNSTLDNYFVLHLSNSTDTVSGEFALVTADGVNFVAINYSNNNLVGSDSVGTFTLDGQDWAISYTGNESTNSTIGGDDVVLTAIPEPSTYALLALGGIALAVFVRRRRRFRC
jgi:autotransporter-associated beta strand protein/T5SS/PEP-CTERM-associated repeat protein